MHVPSYKKCLFKSSKQQLPSSTLIIILHYLAEQLMQNFLVVLSFGTVEYKNTCCILVIVALNVLTGNLEEERQ